MNLANKLVAITKSAIRTKIQFLVALSFTSSDMQDSILSLPKSLFEVAILKCMKKLIGNTPNSYKRPFQKKKKPVRTKS